MKEKTIKDLATLHNRLARLANLFNKIDINEFDEDEQKKFNNLMEQANKLLSKYAVFKIKAFNDRNIEIPDVW